MDDWPTACRFPPWIEDGNGVLFNEAFQLSKLAGHGQPDADRFAPVSSLHDPLNSREEQDNHEPQS